MLRNIENVCLRVSRNGSDNFMKIWWRDGPICRKNLEKKGLHVALSLLVMGTSRTWNDSTVMSRLVVCIGSHTSLKSIREQVSSDVKWIWRRKVEECCNRSGIASSSNCRLYSVIDFTDGWSLTKSSTMSICPGRYVVNSTESSCKSEILIFKKKSRMCGGMSGHNIDVSRSVFRFGKLARIRGKSLFGRCL